jgi:hypothetical protein
MSVLRALLVLGWLLCSYAWRRHGVPLLYSGVNMGIVAFGAIVDLPFTPPHFHPFAMRAILPIQIRGTMTLAADKICLIEIDEFAR